MNVPLDVLAEEIIRDPKLVAVLFQMLDLDDNGMVTPDEITFTQSKMMEPNFWAKGNAPNTRIRLICDKNIFI